MAFHTTIDKLLLRLCKTSTESEQKCDEPGVFQRTSLPFLKYLIGRNQDPVDKYTIPSSQIMHDSLEV